MDRRDFIRNTALASLAFTSLGSCVSKFGNNSQSKIEILSDPKKYMDLPKDFVYKVISKSGQKMDDGFLLPGRPDGMGAFVNDLNELVVIRNHENSPKSPVDSPFGREDELLNKMDRDKFYDAGNLKMPGLGGTTSFIYDEESQSIKKQYLSLAGTYRNCAGGPTPWGSWLTCEEDVTIAGDDIEKDHGFVFEVSSNSSGLVDPKPIKEMGRFHHEAVAVDPETGIVYQTEDRHDGLIYRFIPNVPGDLHKGGKLQALAVKNQKGLDTRNWDEESIAVGQKLDVEWIDVDDVLSPKDDLRYRYHEMGAARFARGEGMWYGDGEIYFACTNGGPKKYGQIFKYRTKDNSLELFTESKEKTVLHMCDNLTVTPWGGVLVCEDNSSENRLHLIDSKGNVHLFAINRSSDSEFAGAVFSPSGKTLFVNIQENGETIAVTGPWDKLSALINKA